MKKEQKRKVILYSTLIIFALAIITFFIFYSGKEKGTLLFEPYCDENFHKCKVLDDPGKIYCISGSYGELIANETSLLDSNSCIDIQADDITLWCLEGISISAGEDIRNNSEAVGIKVLNHNNIKIEGCNLQYWNRSGMNIVSSGSNFSDISVSNSGIGIEGYYPGSVGKVNIINPTLKENNRGIYLYNNLGLLEPNFTFFIIGGQISENLISGIEIREGYRNIIKDILLLNNPVGLLINRSSYNNLDNSVLDTNSIGIQIINGISNNVTNSRIENPEMDSVGIDIDRDSNNNVFYNNLFQNFNNFNPDRAWPISSNIFNLTKSRRTNIIGGLFSGGNFWGDRDGYGFSQFNADCNDGDGDGVCNNEYRSGNGSLIDGHPLSSNLTFSGCNQYITGCTGSKNWAQDETYCLVHSVNITNIDTCFEIANNGVTLDCKGYRIFQDENNAGKAVKVEEKNNITIRNCYFDDLSYNNDYLGEDTYGQNVFGIQIKGVNGLNISGVTMRNVINGSAINLWNTNNIYLSDVNILNTTHSGVYIKNSFNSVLNNVVVDNSKAKSGVYLINFSFGKIKNLVSKNNFEYGLYINSGKNIYLSDFFSNENDLHNSWIRDVSNSSFENIASNSGSGIKLYIVNDTIFRNIISKNVSDIGIDIESISNSKFYNLSAVNSAFSNANLRAGMRSINIFNSSFRDISVYDNNYTGLIIESATNSSFKNVISRNNKNIGLKIKDSLGNGFFNLSTISSSNDGVYLYSSDNNLFTDLFISDVFGSGFSIENSKQNILSRGILRNNNLSGIILHHSSNDISLINLTTESNKLEGINIHLSNRSIISGVISRLNLNGLLLNESSNSIISDSNFTDNLDSGSKIEGNGIVIFNNSNTFNKVNFKRNNLGVKIRYSSKNIINNSNIDENRANGVEISYFSGINEISNNQIKSNFLNGILINCSSAYYCEKNLIYNNYFNNARNALIDGSGINVNDWNTTYDQNKLNIYGISGYGGNFWNDFSSACTNSLSSEDHICDSPYNLSSNNNTDYLPISQYQTSVNCTIVNSCGYQMTQPLSSYCLNTSASFLITSGNCFDISGRNVTLDCQNRIIDGNNSANNGITISYSGSSGIKIKNCKVNNFANSGIRINNGGGVIIESGELNGNFIGIYANSNFNSISANILNSKGDAVQLFGSDNILSSVSISGTNSSYVDLNIFGSGSTDIIDSTISKYLIQSDRLRIKKSEFGEINFLEPISGTGVLSEDILFNSKSIYINSSQTGLNKPSNITLYNTGSGQSKTLSVNGALCDSASSPSCIYTGLDSPSISFKTNSGGLFLVKSYSLSVSSPIDNLQTISDNIKFEFTIFLYPGRSIKNCSVMINNELVYNTSSVEDGNQNNYRYNITNEGLHYWNLTCIDSADQALNKWGWFNKSTLTTSGSGSGTSSSKDCSQILGATICTSIQTCSGQWVNAKDTGRCCNGTCASGNNLPVAETCSQKAGIICSSEEICSSGSFTSASDSDFCCIGTCDSQKTDCSSLGCKINKFFQNKTNLVIVLSVIGIIVLLIIILFVYSFKNKKNSERIRVFQDQQRPVFGGISQYNPVVNKPAQPTAPLITPRITLSAQQKNDEEAKRKAVAISASRLSLRNYILKEIKKGVSASDIKDVLSKANWKDSEIESAISDVQKFINKGK